MIAPPPKARRACTGSRTKRGHPKRVRPTPPTLCKCDGGTTVVDYCICTVSAAPAAVSSVPAVYAVSLLYRCCIADVSAVSAVSAVYPLCPHLFCCICWRQLGLAASSICVNGSFDLGDEKK
eukprot:2299983-Prymnesium_polylepis.1